MPAASCPPCGWSRDYETEKGRKVGLTRHRRENGCLPVRDRLAALGLPVERTVSVSAVGCASHSSTLYELSGYRLREAQLLHERLDDLTDYELRRLARSDAIRARLQDLAA